MFDKPYRNFGRMDDYSRMGLAAISFTLKDAKLDQWIEKRHIGIIASTVYGCLTTDFDYWMTVTDSHGKSPSPNLFTYTLPGCFLGDAAMRFGLTGQTFVLNESSEAFGKSALDVSVLSIEQGETDRYLCGICDAAPLSFLPTVAHITGAVFVMLEEHFQRPKTAYAFIEHNEEKHFYINGKRVCNVIQLVDACLSDRQKIETLSADVSDVSDRSDLQDV